MVPYRGRETRDTRIKAQLIKRLTVIVRFKRKADIGLIREWVSIYKNDTSLLFETAGYFEYYLHAEQNRISLTYTIHAIGSQFSRMKHSLLNWLRG